MRIRRFDDTLPPVHRSRERISNWQTGRISPMPSHVPDGWQLVSLLSVARLESGHTPSRNRPDYWSGSIPWVSLHDSQLLDVPELQHTTLTVTPLGIANSSARLLPKGTVVFSRTATVGKCTIMGREMATSQDFANYVCGHLLHNRYLMHLFRFMSGEWARLMAGSTHNTIYMPIFQSLQILLPSVEEQEAIAQALADGDAWTESLEKLIAKKRKIMHGVMQQLLTGERRLPGFREKWREKRLGELFSVSGGLSASRDQLRAEGICYLHYGDIHTSSKHFIDVEAEQVNIPKLPHQLANSGKRTQLDDGDVVFVDASEDLDGTSKHVVVVNPKGIPFISGLHTIVAKAMSNELDHGYRRYCFQTNAVRSQFRFYAVGTKVSGVSKGNIVQIVLPLPPIDEQRAIASMLMDMDAELVILEQRLFKARQLKQGMMQNLLTGRIRLVKCKPAQEVRVKPQPRIGQDHNWQINEAVVISVLTKTFGSERFPLGRKRYTKLSYLLHRHVERKADGYLKKAAGPYNPSTKYGGPEKIALGNKYIRQHKQGKYEGFVQAEQIGKAQDYFDKWYGPDSVIWLEQFRYARNDDLELWATVDMAMVELRAAGKDVNIGMIKQVFRSHPDWLPKLDRDLFADKGIKDAIEQCEQLFGVDDSEQEFENGTSRAEDARETWHDAERSDREA